jgi:hypothetical protein
MRLTRAASRVYDPRVTAPHDAPPPPSFWFVFDWRLLASVVALGIIGFVSCDVINAKTESLAARFRGEADTTPRPSEWVNGKVVDLDLTLITKDADRLSCADDRDLEGAHCDFMKNKQRRKTDPTRPMDDNRVDVIQPYRTAVGNNLVLVAGLWATPALAMRRHLEPPRGMQDKDLRRFIARCKLKFVGVLEATELRWDYNQQWYPEAKAPVARAEWCDVLEG